MSRPNKRFKRLIDAGLSSAAKLQGKKMVGVELDIADALGYSCSTVQHWRRGYIPMELEQQAHLVGYCIGKGRMNYGWAKDMLYQMYYPDPETLLAELFPSEDALRFRIFVSYQRGVEPDTGTAMEVAQALNDHYIFFDQASQINSREIVRLQSELSQADVVIFLFSTNSIKSEVVLQELEMAVELNIRLLPVWLGYAGAPESRPKVRKELMWALWSGEGDTERLIKEIKDAVVGTPLPLTWDEVEKQCAKSTPLTTSPNPSIFPGTVMPPHSDFYVERKVDQQAYTALAGADLPRWDNTRQGETIVIKGPRQMGKSSLLLRLRQVAREMGRHFVWLDCQLLNPSGTDEVTFFRHFCSELSEGMLPEEGELDWESLPTNQVRTTKYVGQLLRRLSRPCVLALDKAESLMGTTSQDAFFSMLRSWHERRAVKPLWRQLDLVVVTSTEPYAFIKNLNQSPFNVGVVLKLSDFTSEEVAQLNRRYGTPLTQAMERQLMELLHGQPYLVQQALYLLSTKQISATELFARATDDRGPFGDHLRALLWLILRDSKLSVGLEEVVRQHTCSKKKIFFRLRGAGLVRREQEKVVFRSPLYADFFRHHLLTPQARINLSPDDLLAQGTCAVLINGQTVGTAWLVNNEGYLLTAGHLLCQELTEADQFDNEVQVQFMDEPPRLARIIHPPAFEQEKGIDFAILKLTSLPLGRQPLPTSLNRSVSGTFILRGYGQSLGHAATGGGRFEGVVDQQDSSMFRLFRLSSETLVDQGFSGGAVYSDQLEAVVAIQIEAGKGRLGPLRNTVLAMPLYRIADLSATMMPLLDH